MPGNTEEKAKCLEKLNQMQKFIPFLDFMIDKIKKNNNEISLECQLNKFQLLRSMIAEKSGKFGWDVIVKVEDVIEKLISKLDFKEQYEKSRENLAKTDSLNSKTSMATSISIVPSSTTSVTMTTTSSSQAVDSKPQDLPATAVDFIMKTLKISVDGGMKNTTDRVSELLPNSLGANQPPDASEKTMETDLDKDLDGFDLTDCPNLSERDTGNTAIIPETPGKSSPHDDLLSSSREKLLKSLQSRLFPCKTNRPPSQSPAGEKMEKANEPQQNCAFSHTQIQIGERKNKSDFSEKSEHDAVEKNKKVFDTSDKVSGKNVSVVSKLTKPLNIQQRTRTESSNSSGDITLKQKLKEKLSTDICEVYRVPGKSVGGSLRSLKENKNRRKSFVVEEEELFKPDKIFEKGEKRSSISHTLSSGDRKDNQRDKSHRDKSTSESERRREKSNEKVSHKHSSSNSGRNGKDKKRPDSQFRTSTSESKIRKNKNESSKGDKQKEIKLDSNNPKDSAVGRQIEDKNFELDKLNDDELVEFVKENMQSLPHLAKLKSSDLRKAVQSSLLGNSLSVNADADAVSEISDDSFHDLDDDLNGEEKVQSKTKAETFSRKNPVESKETHLPKLIDMEKNLQPNTESKVLEDGGKTKETPLDENVDDEDYVVRLIEETTPRTFPFKKKKGLLELPMPAMDDLFEDISSIESFETVKSPNEWRDPRLVKSFASVENKNKSNKTETNSLLNPEPSKAEKEAWSTSSIRSAVNLLKDTNPKSQTNFGTLPRSNQDRPDPWVVKPIPSLGIPNMSQHLQSNQFTNRYPNESNNSTHRNSSPYSKPPGNTPHISDPRRHSYTASEPKSYAEYKRMKQKEQEKINREQTPKESSKSSGCEVTNLPDMSLRSVVEKEETDRNTSKKSQDCRTSGSRETSAKQNNSKNNPSVRTFEIKKTVPPPRQRRYSDLIDCGAREDLREKRSNFEDSKKFEEEKLRKVFDEKRHSLESEETVSPLEELYGSEKKPQTGRGYGIQNFRIPKKGRSTAQTHSAPNKNQISTVSNNEAKIEAKTEVPDTHCEVDLSKGTKESELSRINVAEATKGSMEEPGSDKRPEASDILVDSTVTEDICSNFADKAKFCADSTKTDSSIIETENCDTADSSEKTKDKCENPLSGTTANAEGEADRSVEGEEKTDLTTNKTDVFEKASKSDAEEQIITSNEPKSLTRKKCEAEMVECDSSIESSTLSKQHFGKDSAVVAKEEITQEFVEALIRKSFQSGEGKLLLAQVKLFEELARKLNSKKLKTIQRIINSESGSSTSSSESFSEDEKKKRKSKKSEQKSKKRKKRGKKSRKHKFSSSSSSSGSEETSEEESCDKGDDKTNSKIIESSVSPTSTDNSLLSEESKSKSSDSSGQKSKSARKRRNQESGRHSSRIKAKQKRNQNKLLEKFLNESPNGELVGDSNTGNSADVPTKESEPKNKPRSKGKWKTELDRLHDDIRSMFISAGVVTATGQRMCRILKQSGGNMNNLDIVKESARMVEEEKLKKVCTRNSRSGNTGSSDNSRSQSLDIGTKPPIDNDEEDPKLKLVPRVSLQRVDLNNFGYGIKVSDDCISFRRMQGRNTAIRGAGVMPGSPKTESSNFSTRNVFLARNKRKFERLKDSTRKKSYMGKKLMDIVKNLPLKMARMKHLHICETKNPVGRGRTKKSPAGKPSKKPGGAKVDLTTEEFKHYAFDKNRKIYHCKLCSHVTKNITAHYKEVHPEHEVLISRLSVGEAKLAKLESEKNNGPPSGDKNWYLGSTKRQIKPPGRGPITYHCRMCNFTKVADVNCFASHVSTHTGEMRYQCPVEGCGVKVYSRDDIKFHVLIKHGKSRYDFYGKVIHLYKLTVEGGRVYGFLCSACNFVQICRINLENHILQHQNAGEDARIIKINLSSKKRKYSRVKPTSSKGNKVNAKIDKVDDKKMSLVEELKCAAPENEAAGRTDTMEAENRKRKHGLVSSGSESGGSDAEEVKKKKLLLDENADAIQIDVMPVKLDEERGRSPFVEEINVADCKMDIDDCVDLKRISNLKGSDIISSMETLESGENSVDVNQENTCCKLKVGPLEALLTENSEVLYECYVKGCLFSTRVFDLFEKHIKISHWKTKWNGVCQICCAGRDNIPPGKGSFKLLTALNHLKLHERVRKSNDKLTTDDLIMELKLLNPTGESAMNDDESDGVEDEDKPTADVNQLEQGQTNANSETPYPAKPLLRVRNLLGDRLSTPKADENEDSNADESLREDSSMFTIENVRSLMETGAENSEIEIDQVCSLKDLIRKPSKKGKTIIVRSCPTRKIAIRPEPSAVSVDVGHINVVQPPVVGHPIVIPSVNPLSSNSPVRIKEAALPRKTNFNMTSKLVPYTDSRRNSKPMMRSTSPGVSKNESSRANSEMKNTHKSECSPDLADILDLCKLGPDIEVITSPTRSVSPVPSGTVHHTPKHSSAGDALEKDTIVPQRLTSTSNAGKKSVKDAKIYKEMLTKKKLCDLFKCMGIECSFTCNDENVFTQHIGLHEAQRRLKRNKGIKTMYVRSANKTTRAYYWQQCAYCCEVLSNSDKALSHHILEEHGHCMFQCAFCFYRALSHRYVEIHQNLAHSHIIKTTPRVIYKCKPLKVPPSQSVALEKHGRKQSVRPYHCDQCGKKFFITQDFMMHLSTEHQGVTAYTCHICKNLCFKVNRLINHYKLHSYSTYQCPYCLHGTETEKEMGFHLCSFHFSQPAVLYVRALAEGQSGDEIEKPKTKKKNLNNQLDSLKVIVYDSDSQHSDCIVDADPEEPLENLPESSADVTAIVAELGIITETQKCSTSVTPLIKELASIGNKSTKHLTVKTLLPNAQFSSENESGTENCSVLISSGLSIPSDSTNEAREMNIPLGQLPLESVSVQHKEAPVASSIGSPERNLRLNEIIVNLQQKDKSLVKSPIEEEKTSQTTAVIVSAAVHKLPPVVLGRSSAKNAYPVKNVRKKSEESQNGENPEGSRMLGKEKIENEGKATEEKSKNSYQGERNEEAVNKPSIEKQNEENSKLTDQPLMAKVINLSDNDFDKDKSVQSVDDSVIISDICSLSPSSVVEKDNSNQPGGFMNTNLLRPNKSTVSGGPVLQPPIIRVEDFAIDENTNPTPVNSNEKLSKVDSTVSKKTDEETEEMESTCPPSPDIIILENEKLEDIVTVILDSDDEKDENTKKEKEKNLEEKKDEVNPPTGENETIRKEIELLRDQISNETNSLLVDEVETQKRRPNLQLTIGIDQTQKIDPVAKTLLSPIEEAICSLNKRLKSESHEVQKNTIGEVEQMKVNESPKKPDLSNTKVPGRPRTRYGVRERRKFDVDKSDGDDSGSKKDEGGKNKKFKDGLMGKELFICGNEKCDFAADDDYSLKDHLYVCDLSRESTMLVCPHCSRQIKQFHPYLEHLKYHGEKKFHCGVCEFSSGVDTSVSRHVKQKHKCSVIKILPKESKEGHLLFYPKNYKVDKFDFEVNGYSPGDEDKLPLQSVYQVNVKCAKCPYFTKVRSNMVRHLKIHVKSVETEGVVVVPSTAPTNPVPCLETKERMFDKMTNLAASSQLAQAKEKTAVENLSPEEEAKLPQYVPEQMRYKCCLPDCNYLTVDDGILRHHIKALHDEINYYSCPHCKSTVHVDVRHVTLDKIGFHLKHHDAKLYKCAHCIYFHYQKNVVEKHTMEKHPDRRYFVHVVREPKLEITSEEEPSSSECRARAWKCGLCDDRPIFPSKSNLMDHLSKSHNTKSKYKCKLCSVKANNYQVFSSHFASKHAGEKVAYQCVYYSEKVASNSLESQSGNSSGADSSNEHFDTTPLWQRGAPRVRHIRGILIEEEEIKTKKSKKASACESEPETTEGAVLVKNAFYCPLCTNKKKPFFTRNKYFFRNHLYQELNYQQFACILCGKMFVDKKDFERHHARVHPDKLHSVKQTKDDHEIKFWVDQVIAKQWNEMKERKRKDRDEEEGESEQPSKKKKEV